MVNAGLNTFTRSKHGSRQKEHIGQDKKSNLLGHRKNSILALVS